LFKIIENKLATEGIGTFSYYVLDEGSHQTVIVTDDSWLVVDVRDLYDDNSNSLEDYEKKIDLTWELIQKHGKAVICCVAGISRSNAIALGVLVKYFNMAFYEAHELIGNRVPIANINQSHISKLKTLLNVTIP
jgi:protein-tyrosine phosphatase